MRSKRLIFRYKQFVRPLARRVAAELMANERKSPDELYALNWERRKDLIRLAADKSRYYRRVFKAIGLSPEDVRTERDFEKIPPLTKQDIRENFNDILTDDSAPGRLRAVATGGSTGEPLKVMVLRDLPFDAFSARMLAGWGVDISDNSAFIYRYNPQSSLFSKALNTLAWLPTRRVFLDAGFLSAEACASFLDRALSVRPVWMCGYVGAVSAFADYLESGGLRFPDSLKALWTTSAPLPLFLRKRLERIFGCPVYTQYGSCEVFHLAAECAERSGMHINSEYRHVEAVDDQGRNMESGRVGDLLITDMMNLSFPLIRYKLGDRGRMLDGKCPCGSGLPMMDYVHGRVSENIYLPDGTCVAGEFLTTLFDDAPELVKSFQIRQSRDHSVVLRYVPGPRFDPGAFSLVLKGLRDRCVGVDKVSGEMVQEIPAVRGKPRYVLSELSRNGVAF